MKKIVRLTESDLVRIIKKIINEERSVIVEDYRINNPEVKISKFTGKGQGNQISVTSGNQTYNYKINYSEVFGSADGSDKYKVNFDTISQKGNNLIINRWIEGGKTEPIEIKMEDVVGLSQGQNLEKFTGAGTVFVLKMS